MMNFYSLYKSILCKVKQDESLLSLLEQKIISTPALSKQFIIFETLLQTNKSLEKAKELVSLVENHTSKCSYKDFAIANRTLAHYFNISESSIHSEDLDATIDEMLRMSGGGSVKSFNPSYRKNLIENLTKSSEVKQEELLEIISEEVNKEINKLNFLETEFVNVVCQRNFEKIENKLNKISILSEGLNNKDKILITECVSRLKEDSTREDFKQVAYKTYELQQTLLNLLESKNKIKTTTAESNVFDHLKEATVSLVLNESSNVVIKFKIDFKANSSSSKQLKETAEKLKRHFNYLGKKTLENIITENKKFKSEQAWDSTILMEGLTLTSPITACVETLLTPTIKLTENELLTSVGNMLVEFDSQMSNIFTEYLITQ